MHPLSIVLQRLMNYHPISFFRHFPNNFLCRYVEFVYQLIIKLTSPTLALALVSFWHFLLFVSLKEIHFKNNNDITYIPALYNLYIVWRILMKNHSLFNCDEPIDFFSMNRQILEVFMQNVLMAPFGTRQLIEENELIDENQEYEDDREVFSELLYEIAYFSLFSLDEFLSFIFE